MLIHCSLKSYFWTQFCYRHMHFERSLYYFSQFSVDIVNLFRHDKREI